MILSQQLFFIFLVSGLLMIGIEIFVPGGVVGALGALALAAAMVIGFTAFPHLGGLIAAGIIVLVGFVLLLWIRVFPNTSLGKRMTVSKDLSSAKANQAGIPALLGKTGIATTELRPAGYATLDGARVDVVTRGEMIEKGTAVKVVAVDGNRVVVAALPRT